MKVQMVDCSQQPGISLVTAASMQGQPSQGRSLVRQQLSGACRRLCSDAVLLQNVKQLLLFGFNELGPGPGAPTGCAEVRSAQAQPWSVSFIIRQTACSSAATDLQLMEATVRAGTSLNSTRELFGLGRVSSVNLLGIMKAMVYLQEPICSVSGHAGQLSHHRNACGPWHEPGCL